MAGDEPIPLDAYRNRPVTPFDRLYRQRVLFLRGPLEDAAADQLAAELLTLDSDSDDDITLIIDSPGGAPHGMLAVHDVMQSMRSRVRTRCVGLAASAGAVLLATGTGTRSASPNARIMLRQPLGSAEGTAADVSTQAEQATFLRQRVERILADRTGQPIERIHADTDRELWLSAEEARDYGVIDEVA